MCRFVKAWCSDSGGKCSPGNDKPAAAAACNECNKAAECSCALRRNSATDDDRASVEVKELNVEDMAAETAVTVFKAFDCDIIGSERIDEQVVDVEEPEVVSGFIGQHEHKPGNPAKIFIINIQSIHNLYCDQSYFWYFFLILRYTEHRWLIIKI